MVRHVTSTLEYPMRERVLAALIASRRPRSAIELGYLSRRTAYESSKNKRPRRDGWLVKRALRYLRERGLIERLPETRKVKLILDKRRLRGRPSFLHTPTEYGKQWLKNRIAVAEQKNDIRTVRKQRA